MATLFSFVGGTVTAAKEVDEWDSHIDLDLLDPAFTGDRTTGMGRLAGVPVARFASPPALPEDVVARAKEWLVGRSRFRRVVAFAPFANGRVQPRSWTLEQTHRFLRLASPDDLIVLLDSAPFHTPKSDGVLNLTGRTSLIEALACVAESDLFVGVDSGLLYAAAVFRTPALGLFTHVVATQRICLAENFIALQPSLPCAPCGDMLTRRFSDGYECTYQEPACRTALRPETVLDEMERLDRDRPLREIVSIDPSGHLCRWNMAAFSPPDQMPDFTSIVVVNHNTWEACTRECVRLAVQNTLRPFEIILVDNGSDPAEVARIRAELPPEAELITLNENVDFSVGANRGLEKVSAATRLVCLLHSGCLIREPGWNRKALRHFNDDWRLGAVSLARDDGWHFLDGETGERYAYEFDRSRLDSEVLSGACFVVDRKKAGDVRFDESFASSGHESDDLSFQIRSQGWSIGQMPHYDIERLDGRPAENVTECFRIRGEEFAADELRKRDRRRLREKWRPLLHPRRDAGRDRLHISQFYKPLVSVIMPTAPERSDLRRIAVESVKAQDCREWELLIVTDSAADRTVCEAEVLGDRRISVVVSSTSLPGAKRNAALSRAHGFYHAFLDDDDIWLPDHLSFLADYWRTHSRVDIAYSDTRHVEGFFTPPDAESLDSVHHHDVDEESPSNRSSQPAATSSIRHPASSIEHPTSRFIEVADLGHPGCRTFNAPDFLKFGWISFSSVMMRAEVFRRVGEIDESLMYAEDWDFLSRAVRGGLRIEHACSLSVIGHATYEYRKHAQGLTTAKNNAEWERCHGKVRLANAGAVG